MLGFSEYHLYCVYYLLIFEALYLLCICAPLKNLHRYIWRIRVLLPAYYMGYALVFFTGLLLEADKHFEGFSWLRLAALVVALALAIVEFKRFKAARRAKNLEPFKRAAIGFELAKFAIFAAAGWAI